MLNFILQFTISVANDKKGKKIKFITLKYC